MIIPLMSGDSINGSINVLITSVSSKIMLPSMFTIVKFPVSLLVNIIISFELIYYLSDIDRFFFEANRILSKKGHLIICTTNKDWSDFNRSPFSTKYFSVPELYNKAKSFGFSVNMFGSFPDSHTNITSKLVSIIKRIVVRLHLMPKTMKGKVLFKKMFLGKMVSMPLVLSEDMFSYESPVPIPENEIDRIHTAIFAVCQKI